MNTGSEHTPRITVGLSGGVDSAVTAALLKEAGYDVSAIFMQNWPSDDPQCTASVDLSDAQSVADHLNIPLSVINLCDEYRQRVFDHCLDDFAAGNTPNPDVWCNKEIKFGVFLEHILTQHQTSLATGHYATVKQIGDHYELHKGIDTNKDQSYFLYWLNQKQLSHAQFPLGNYEKPQIREIAKRLRLPNATKKDSTGICFIGERQFKPFLQNFLLAQPGVIRTPNEREIGQHDGVIFYTLGQRKGLNIGGRQGADDAPWYVVHKDLENNELIVAQEHDHPLIMRKECVLKDMHWISGVTPNEPVICQAKTRYRQADQAATLTPLDNNSSHIRFEEPQRALTPGQSVVLYQGSQCLGGGIITLP